MKILKLKYKMHRLVNIAFYLIIFIFGFLIGFTTQKIDFSKLISEVLFIDSVNAESEITASYICRSSRNLYNDKAQTTLYFYNSSGVKEEDGDGNTYIETVIENPSSKYVVSFTSSVGSAYMRFTFFKGDKFISRILVNKSREIVNVPIETTKIIISTNKNDTMHFKKLQIEEGDTVTEYIPFGEEICIDESNSDNFYEFSQKIFGPVDDENKFIYDIICFFLVSVVFILMILIIGYIIKKFLGG